MLDFDEYVNNSTDAEAEAASYGNYIGSESNFLDSYGNTVQDIVRKQIRNKGGEPVSVLNRNPLLDTSKYKVQYIDGFVEDMNENQITEKILLQVDSERNQFFLMKDITDH